VSSYSRQVDEKLLTEARQAKERLIDAERDAEVFRAEFHRAVRRLHLHGASLRELAGALGLSHQRVHQIVESAGGSRRWLRQRQPGQRQPGQRQPGQHQPGQRAPGRRKPRLACTFCGQDQTQARKLIAGAHVFICNDCVGVARDVINTRPPPGARFLPVFATPGQDQPKCEPRPRMACSFCGKQVHQVTGLAVSAVPPAATSAPAAPEAILTERPAICTECLDLCDEIIAEDLPETPNPA
jgi:ClpX C4-type zinc finger